MQYQPPVAAAPAPAPVAPRGAFAAAPSVASYAYAPANEPYTLDAGDKLRIVVFGQDGITGSYMVGASGAVSLPLVGSLSARGLTTQQLAGAIVARLKQGYVREPHVTVEVETYRPFFIMGEVTTPGQYAYVPNMTAENAVAIAGGFAPRADKRQIEVTRTAAGQRITSMVPLGYQLRPGDTVVVKERWF
jgi:polysaccharide export outer membrane protein